MERISFAQSVKRLVRGEVRQLWTFPVHVIEGTSKLAYTPGLIFSVIRIIWETKKAPKLLSLEERASVSNKLKTTTRGSTHYTSLGGKEQEATDGVGGKIALGPIPLKECAVSREIIKQNRNILIRQSFLILLHHLAVPRCSRGPEQWVIIHSICSDLCSTYGIDIAETGDKSSPAVLWLS